MTDAKPPQTTIKEEDLTEDGPGAMEHLRSAVSKAKAMQSKVSSFHSDLEAMSFTGEAANGLVRATCNGRGHLTGLQLSDDAVADTKPAILQELILSAARSAREEAAKAATAKASTLTDGLPIPTSLGAMLAALMPGK
jgi:DNA-binding protein YbaB